MSAIDPAQITDLVDRNLRNARQLRAEHLARTGNAWTSGLRNITRRLFHAIWKRVPAPQPWTITFHRPSANRPCC